MIQDKIKIIAATTSPMRKKLLKKSYKNIKFIKPSYQEKNYHYFISPVLLSLYHSFKKAISIHSPHSIILGFDTIVYRGLKIYSKPKNKKEALNIICQLNNKIHNVVTGITVKYNNKLKYLYSISQVKFKFLTKKIIQMYLHSHLWKGKAGGYGIQDKKNKLIEWYKGDYENIVGVPITLLKKEIPSIYQNRIIKLFKSTG